MRNVEAGGEITYEIVTAIDGYHEVEKLQAAIWGRNDTVPLHMLLTAHKNCGLLIGARAPSGDMVGFVFGFLGRMDDKLRHCSHMAGVLSDWRSAGIGEQLKWRQADAARDQGLDLVVWTYDPLLAPNANLNLHKLGGIVRSYTPNLYGIMTDLQNAGSDSDRLSVEWWINSERFRRHRLGVEIHPTLEQLIAQGAEFAVEAGSGNAPVVYPWAKGDVLLIEIPNDFMGMKRANSTLAAWWRNAVRERLQALIAADWVICDFVRQSGPDGRRAIYVLRPSSALELPARVKV